MGHCCTAAPYRSYILQVVHVLFKNVHSGQACSHVCLVTCVCVCVCAMCGGVVCALTFTNFMLYVCVCVCVCVCVLVKEFERERERADLCGCVGTTPTARGLSAERAHASFRPTIHPLPAGLEDLASFFGANYPHIRTTQ